MLSVELDIFSGMPNPRWILSPEEERELLDRVMANPQMMQPVSKQAVDLGYRGMIVELVKEDDNAWSKARESSLKNPAAYGAPLPAAFRLHGHVTRTDDSAEQWLVETSDKADSEVDDFLRSYMQGLRPNLQDTPESEVTTQGGAGDIGAQGHGMSCGNNYFTGNDFVFWNGTYIENNNCYNFAANYRNTRGYGNKAQPGIRGGRRFTQFTQADLTAALLRDGWKHSCDRSRNLTIALVVMLRSRGNPGDDFHCYRMVTSSGTWGHKPGHSPAKSTDSSGRTIRNPATCDRRIYVNGRFLPGYTEFYGYFYQDNSTAIVY